MWPNHCLLIIQISWSIWEIIFILCLSGQLLPDSWLDVLIFLFIIVQRTRNEQLHKFNLQFSTLIGFLDSINIVKKAIYECPVINIFINSGSDVVRILVLRSPWSAIRIVWTSIGAPTLLCFETIVFILIICFYTKIY